MTMPKRSRIRHLLKWGAMIWCIVLLFVWGLSPWMRVVSTWNDLILTLEGGRVSVTKIIAAPGTKPEYVTAFTTQRGKFVSQSSGPTAGEGNWGWIDLWFPRKRFIYFPDNWGKVTVHYVALPFWLLFIPSLLVTAFLWWHRRFPPGHCQRCGYNLTGNVSGKCSECGEPCDTDGRET